MVALLVLAGCQSHQLTRTSIEPSSIPDQAYNVTIYRVLVSPSYAVLFDIPDDGTKVFIRNTHFTDEMGEGFSGTHIVEFQQRIKFYRTIRIGDQDGTVRAYLMVSGDLTYWIIPVREGIMVDIQREPGIR